MRKWLFTMLLVLAAAISASAQSVDCPLNMVCISPEAGRKALQDSDTVKAQAAEIKVKDQAIVGLKSEIARMQIELAKTTGELTGAEKQIIRCEARTDILLKYVRPKKIGLINF